MLSSKSVSFCWLSAVSHALFSFRWRVSWTRLALESQEVQGEGLLLQHFKILKLCGSFICAYCLGQYYDLRESYKLTRVATDRKQISLSVCFWLEWGSVSSHSILLTNVALTIVNTANFVISATKHIKLAWHVFTNCTVSKNKSYKLFYYWGYNLIQLSILI